MATITDYLTWRGDLTFAERPFNAVDNIVLSALAYAPLAQVTSRLRGRAQSIAEVASRLLAEDAGDTGALPAPEKCFLRALATSRRFGPALLDHVREHHDHTQATQFAAATITLPCEGGTYVVYRGTDNSLVGWREDFLLGSRVTGAQRMAAGYLLRVLARGWRGKLYVGGHSKGGNLALYAALACPQSLRYNLACVYNNDGPGLAQEVLPGVSPSALGTRLVRLVPQYCLVGALFHAPEQPRLVVRSTAQGAKQHDVSTWMVGAENPVFADDLLPSCKRMSTALCAWIAEMSVSEREHVVQEAFDVLAAGGATELDEVFSTPARTAAVMRALRSASDLTKRAVRRLAMACGHSLLLNMHEAACGRTRTGEAPGR